MESGILYHVPTDEISNQSEATTEAGYETTEGKVDGLEQLAKDMRTFVLPTIYSTVCIIGLIGNGLVIYIMHLKARNRNITDLYVLNLAIADFIFVAMLPFWTTDIALNNRWIFGQVLCKLTSGSTYFHMYASVFFLTAMSVDRFFAVVMYHRSRNYRTKTTAAVGVLIIWLLSTLFGLLPLFFRNVVNNGGKPICDWTFNSTIPSHTHWFLTYVISRSLFGFAVPFLIILVSYSLIIFFLKTRETRGRLTSKCQDRATKMVLVVIGVFLLCWLPNQISNLIYVAQSFKIVEIPETSSKIHYCVHMFSTCLAWMHSCINPILYAFMREDLRLKLTEIMNHCVKRCCGRRSRQELTMKLRRGISKRGTVPLEEQNSDPRRSDERPSITQSMRPAKQNDGNVDEQNEKNEVHLQECQTIANVYCNAVKKDDASVKFQQTYQATSKCDEEETRMFDADIEVYDNAKHDAITNASYEGVRTRLLDDVKDTKFL